MKKWPYFAVGGGLSLAYLLTLYILDNSILSFLSSNAEWNEKGDFLAGAAAPLAFFWLIVGYWMQTAELGLMRRQLEQELQSLRRVEKGQIEMHSQIVEGNELQRQISPPSIMACLVKSDSQYKVTLSNRGGDAKQVYLHAGNEFFGKLDELSGEAELDVSLRQLNTGESLEVMYTDVRTDAHFIKVFPVEKTSNSWATDGVWLNPDKVANSLGTLSPGSRARNRAQAYEREKGSLR